MSSSPARLRPPPSMTRFGAAETSCFRAFSPATTSSRSTARRVSAPCGKARWSRPIRATTSCPEASTPTRSTREQATIWSTAAAATTRSMAKAGTDILFGDRGADALFGGDDNDFLYGGGGQDVILGSQGADFVRGGDDADLISGGVGSDELHGDDG